MTPTPDPQRGRTRVLVVDDDDDLRRWIRTNLEEAGYSVIEASSGFEALEDLVERNVDVVLLDHRLPRLDGDRVIRAFGSAEFPVPIVAITGTTDAEEFAREIGAEAYLTKPFEVDDLYAAIDRVRCARGD